MKGAIDLSLQDFRTRDGDLSRPLRRSIKHSLFDGLHLLGMVQFGHMKHEPYELKDLRFVSLSDLHAVLHSRDDMQGSVLCSRFGAFLSSSWKSEKLVISKFNETAKIISKCLVS